MSQRIRLLTLHSALENRDFSETELNEIRDIAAQCPEIGGKPVTIARGLLPFSESVAYEASNIDQHCYVEARSEKQHGVRDDLKMQLSLYPNPSSGHITAILTKNEPVIFRVYNTLGRLEFAKTIESGNVGVWEIDNLEAGWHIVEFQKGITGERYFQKANIFKD